MNVQNSIFWNGDFTNTEGHALRGLFQNFDFEQVIQEPTRIVGNSKSCRDLLLANNCLPLFDVGTKNVIVNILVHCNIYATLKTY